MNKKITAGIIGAMECEIRLLRAELSEIREEKIGVFTFYRGSIGDIDVVLARAGVGKVNAAICATLMASAFAPDFIVNTGCMGGLEPGLHVLDVVAAERTAEHDLDYGLLGDERGTVFLPDGSSAKFFDTDAELTDKIVRAAELCGSRVIRGTIASGDIFVSNADDKALIRNGFDAAGTEMEGAAVGHACAALKLPFALIRCVSDGADGDAHMSFEEFSVKASEISARITLKFLSML
ncbi:MAG: 5'-methylthioadenosine/adenosylhomocysteine nucleosidase [Clostridia bacterium]|nr:5'-methylthioadenosine/adenosylhomocysteine nucleosidase [Clostridia bacterium]